MKHFDVVVIGGGHAGTEAAAAAARLGATVLLVTMKKASVGVMSCNPAIGGLGKGHLVREIDALDGIMGLAADHAGIQFRLLNRRKGAAVQGPRAQADRTLYRTAIQKKLFAQDGLFVVEAEAASLKIHAGVVAGVELRDGSLIGARAVVLTAGTFLNGVMHIGKKMEEGGRVGDVASTLLAEQLSGFGFSTGRLKTGTPPRLDGRTIDWSVLEHQPGDEDPVMFSFLSDRPLARQVSCGITTTNEKTHDIVKNNIHESAMHSGNISGVGPRYCPSIEDKVVRFPDKDGHQIFLEPEGLDVDTVYPNGISTSLPAETQEAYVKSIRGLEQVKITQFGYAIEYDFFDPRGLTSSLQTKNVPGLFMAGQINGTTGYEEAAAQGLVAGLNAAQLALGREATLFSRSESYIGVMIDDLTTFGVTEPYRMFTSRAEFRLSLRADNADQRLTEVGYHAGCVSEGRMRAYSEKREALDRARQVVAATRFSAKALEASGLHVSEGSATKSGSELLSVGGINDDILCSLVEPFRAFDRGIREQVLRDGLYSHYLVRQQRDVDRLKKEENLPIPEDLSFELLSGLSKELAVKLNRQRPMNIFQASRIEGMTPAALLVLTAAIRPVRTKERAKQ